MHGFGAGEIFLDDAAFENSLDAVRPMISLTRIISRPGQVPLADPELELLLLRLRTGLGLRRRIVMPGAGEAGQKQDDNSQPDLHGWFLPRFLAIRRRSNENGSRTRQGNTAVPTQSAP